MILSFTKYHGSGNDFILIDQRSTDWIPKKDEIAWLCNRRLGIGADGLIVLTEKTGFDFGMIYYNSDGRESSMCGNGGRCLVAEAARLGRISNKAYFHASDGGHEAIILNSSGNISEIRLFMAGCHSLREYEDGIFLNTGSPHFVRFVDSTEDINVIEKGRELRYEARFAPEGSNVNFVSIHPDYLDVRTYERGVEDETLSCGTGVTASALAAALINPVNRGYYHIKTRGGELKVGFHQSGRSFDNIWLEGPACFVFSGKILTHDQ